MITITITQSEALMIKDALQPFAEKRNPPRSNRKVHAKNLIDRLQKEVWTDFKREVGEPTVERMRTRKAQSARGQRK